MNEQGPGRAAGGSGDESIETVLVEPVPGTVIARAKSLHRCEDEGELAVLTFDSLVDGNDRPEDHHMRFQHQEMQLDVRISAGRSVSRISGKLSSPVGEQVVLSPRDCDDVSVATVEEGCFTFESTPPGVVRLGFHASDPTRPTIWTDWFRV